MEVLIIFPVILQTVINLIMLSTGGEGTVASGISQQGCAVSEVMVISEVSEKMYQEYHSTTSTYFNAFAICRYWGRMLSASSIYSWVF